MNSKILFYGRKMGSLQDGYVRLLGTEKGADKNMSVLGKLFKRGVSKDKQAYNEPATNDTGIEATANTDADSEAEEEYEVVEREIAPARIICPDCGGITLEGLEFCDKCGGELQ